MNNNIYAQIPLAKKAKYCPVCENTFKERKTINILLYSIKETKVVECKLLYCKKCKLASSDGTVQRIQQIYNGYKANVFMVSPDMRLEEVKQKIQIPCLPSILKNEEIFWDKNSEKIKREREIKLKKEASLFWKRNTKKYLSIKSSFLLLSAIIKGKHCHYVIVTDPTEENPENKVIHYTTELARKLMTAERGKNKKPEITYSRYIKHSSGWFVPKTISINSLNNMKGQSTAILVYSPKTTRCEVLQAFLDVEKKEYVVEIGEYLEFVKNYGDPDFDVGQYDYYGKHSIHPDELVSYLEKRKRFMQTPTALVMFETLTDGVKKDYIIVANYRKDSNENAEVLRYSDEFAGELLLSLRSNSINRSFEYQDKKIIIQHSIIPTNTVLAPKEIIIRRDGGYYSTDSDYEVVDLFLPLCKRKGFERIKASYDKMDKLYFIDPIVFRRFIQAFGKPDINIFLAHRNYYTDGVSNLNDESLLMEYGYSVSQSKSLSFHERQELLAELVDLNLLSVSYIVRMLEMFIRMHPSSKYDYARFCWAHDKDFIENYKVNPERFLLVK